MRTLDREGTFMGTPVGWGVRKSEDTQSVGIEIEFRVLAQFDEGGWAPWTDYEEHHVRGTFWVVGKTGAPNVTAIDQLRASLGWNGQFPSSRNPHPEGQCQLVVEENVWKDKTNYRVAWLNPEDHTPGVRSLSDEECAMLDRQYGSQFRAALGVQPAAAAPQTGSKARPRGTKQPPAPPPHRDQDELTFPGADDRN